MVVDPQYVPHILAVAWFALCWLGYARYAIWKGRDTPCLASVLHLYRKTGCAACCCAITASPMPT